MSTRSQNTAPVAEWGGPMMVARQQPKIDFDLQIKLSGHTHTHTHSNWLGRLSPHGGGGDGKPMHNNEFDFDHASWPLIRYRRALFEYIYICTINNLVSLWRRLGKRLFQNANNDLYVYVWRPIKIGPYVAPLPGDCRQQRLTVVWIPYNLTAGLVWMSDVFLGAHARMSFSTGWTAPSRTYGIVEAKWWAEWENACHRIRFIMKSDSESLSWITSIYAAQRPFRVFTLKLVKLYEVVGGRFVSWRYIYSQFYAKLFGR